MGTKTEKSQVAEPDFFKGLKNPSFLKSESRVQIIRLLESCSFVE